MTLEESTAGKGPVHSQKSAHERRLLSNDSRVSIAEVLEMDGGDCRIEDGLLGKVLLVQE